MCAKFWPRSLTELEQTILLWLAIERETVDAQTLRRNLTTLPGHAFLEALRSLQHRSLIERQRDGLGLQNVVTEFLTERLVAAACGEIQTGQPNLLHRHALVKATASDEVRQSQIRLILAPVADQLRGALGQAALVETLRTFLIGLRQTALHQPSYAGVFCVFLINPCSSAMFVLRTVNKTRAIRPPLRFERTSHRSASIFRTSSIPGGQRNCTSLMSSPMTCPTSILTHPDTPSSLAGPAPRPAPGRRAPRCPSPGHRRGWRSAGPGGRSALPATWWSLPG